MEQASKHAMTTLWKKAAAHRNGQGLESGCDMHSASQQYSKLRAEGSHGQAEALAQVLTGGYLTNARRKEVCKESCLESEASERKKTPSRPPAGAMLGLWFGLYSSR